MRAVGEATYPEDVDEDYVENGWRTGSSAAAASQQTTPLTIFWWMGILACIGFSVVASSILLNYTYNSSYNGGDRGQWRYIDHLNLNVTSIWQFLQQQFQCMSCAGGQLTVQDTLLVNGTLLLTNQSQPTPVDVMLVIQSLQDQNNLLSIQLQQAIATIPPVAAALRLEVINFETIFSSVPFTQFIPFTDTGFFGYERDPTGLFDTSNDNYTVVTRDAIVQASSQIYFSANSTESYVICFFMPFTNSTPGAEPTLLSGVGESTNITAFGGFPYAGVVTMVGSFSAKAGWELNIRCAISEGEPLDFIVTSHLDLLEIV